MMLGGMSLLGFSMGAHLAEFGRSESLRHGGRRNRHVADT